MFAPIKQIGPASSIHAHHTESVDPTLAGWINDLLHELLGWGPWTFVAVFGVAIVAIPIWLIYTTLRNGTVVDEFEGDEE